MHVLWSRAGRARPISLHLQTVARGFGPRSTAATTRRLRASDVFTAAYTAMFATAAVIDAKHKRARRKAWDIAIEQARNAPLLAPPEAEDSVDHKYGPDTTLTSLSILALMGKMDYAGLRAVVPAKVWATKNLLMQLSELQAALQIQETTTDMDKHNETRNVTTAGEAKLESPQPILEAGDVPWSSGLYTSQGEDVHGWQHRLPKKEVHFSRMKQMVANLANRLLEIVTTRRVQCVAECDAPVLQLQLELARAVRTMQDQSGSLPQFELLNTNHHQQELSAVSQRLSDLFKSATSDCLGSTSVTAMLCYQLLTLRCPPTIEIYHKILAYFNESRQYDLAAVVIDSIINESKFRQTSTTQIMVLDHYAATKDRKGFAATIRRMNASEGNTRVGRRHLNDLIFPEVQNWATMPGNSPLKRNGQLHLKALRNTRVYSALIDGSLELCQLSNALTYAKMAFKQGPGMSQGVLVKLVDILQYLPTQALVAVASDLLKRLLVWSRDSLERIDQCRDAIIKLVLFSGIEVCQQSGTCTHVPTSLDNRGIRRVVRVIVHGHNRRMSSSTVAATAACADTAQMIPGEKIRRSLRCQPSLSSRQERVVGEYMDTYAKRVQVSGNLSCFQSHDLGADKSLEGQSTQTAEQIAFARAIKLASVARVDELRKRMNLSAPWYELLGTPDIVLESGTRPVAAQQTKVQQERRKNTVAVSTTSRRQTDHTPPISTTAAARISTGPEDEDMVLDLACRTEGHGKRQHSEIRSAPTQHMSDVLDTSIQEPSTEPMFVDTFQGRSQPKKWTSVSEQSEDLHTISEAQWAAYAQAYSLRNAELHRQNHDFLYQATA